MPATGLQSPAKPSIPKIEIAYMSGPLAACVPEEEPPEEVVVVVVVVVSGEVDVVVVVVAVEDSPPDVETDPLEVLVEDAVQMNVIVPLSLLVTVPVGR
jgi:hypothetical protein